MESGIGVFVLNPDNKADRVWLQGTVLDKHVREDTKTDIIVKIDAGREGNAKPMELTFLMDEAIEDAINIKRRNDNTLGVVTEKLPT